MGTLENSIMDDHEKRLNELEAEVSDMNRTIQSLMSEVSQLKSNSATGNISGMQIGNLGKEKRMSIREFLDTKKINGHYDRAICVAYFKEIREKKTPLTVKELEDGYREAKEQLPKNLSDTIYRNTIRGYIMESKDNIAKNNRHSWELTNKGIKHVEEELEKRGK